MRRLTSVGVGFLVVGLTVFVVGCGSNSGTTAKGAGGGSGNASSTSKKGLRVGFVYVSPLPASSFSLSWDQTRKDLEQKYGAITTVVQPIPQSPSVVGVLQDLVRKGNKLIFATAIGYQPFVVQVAKQNPDVNFVVTGPWTLKVKRPPNVADVKGDVWPLAYLTGKLAARMSKTKTLGFVAGFSIPSMVAEINAFEQGARAVDPSVKTRVVLSNTWYDPATTTQAAETLAHAGADVIAKHVDDNGPCLGAKAAGVYCIGSMIDRDSQTPKTALVSWVYNWRKIGETKYVQTRDGKFTNDETTGNIDTGYVLLGPMNDKIVPHNVQQDVLATEKKLKSGKLNVFDGPIRSNTGQIMLPAGKSWSTADEVYGHATFYEDGVIGHVSK